MFDVISMHFDNKKKHLHNEACEKYKDNKKCT